MDRKVSDVRARQGFRGRPVLGILVISLTLIVLAFAGMLIWAWSTTPETGDGVMIEQDPPLTSPASPGNPLPTMDDAQQAPPPGQPTEPAQPTQPAPQ